MSSIVDLLVDFPGLAIEGFEPTSPETSDYNCIAWADYDQANWWWPFGKHPGNSNKEAFWPAGAPRKATIPAFITAFRRRGFTKCMTLDTSLVEGIEKIAIYALGHEPKHAARQLPDGRWTHKLGQNIDLTTSLTAVEGNIYGKVVIIMERVRP